MFDREKRIAEIRERDRAAQKNQKHLPVSARSDGTNDRHFLLAELDRLTALLHNIQSGYPECTNDDCSCEVHEWFEWDGWDDLNRALNPQFCVVCGEYVPGPGQVSQSWVRHHLCDAHRSEWDESEESAPSWPKHPAHATYNPTEALDTWLARKGVTRKKWRKRTPRGTCEVARYGNA